MTRIAIVDDYQNIALTLADWRSIPDAEFTVFDQPFASEDETVGKLGDFEIVSTMRERMEWPAGLFARLPKLKLLCVTGLHQRLLDQAANHARTIDHQHARVVGGQVAGQLGVCTHVLGRPVRR